MADDRIDDDVIEQVKPPTADESRQFLYALRTYGGDFGKRFAEAWERAQAAMAEAKADPQENAQGS